MISPFVNPVVIVEELEMIVAVSKADIRVTLSIRSAERATPVKVVPSP